jgi:hypothetical protein
LGAVALAKCVVAKAGIKLLCINGNFIPAEGVEEVEALFEGAACGASALGSLEDNDEVRT